jgi:hypothetical protein
MDLLHKVVTKWMKFFTLLVDLLDFCFEMDDLLVMDVITLLETRCSDFSKDRMMMQHGRRHLF